MRNQERKVVWCQSTGMVLQHSCTVAVEQKGKAYKIRMETISPINQNRLSWNHENFHHTNSGLLDQLFKALHHPSINKEDNAPTHCQSLLSTIKYKFITTQTHISHSSKPYYHLHDFSHYPRHVLTLILSLNIPSIISFLDSTAKIILASSSPSFAKAKAIPVIYSKMKMFTFTSPAMW